MGERARALKFGGRTGKGDREEWAGGCGHDNVTGFTTLVQTRISLKLKTIFL